MRSIKFRAWDKIKKEFTLNDSFYELQKWNRTEKELENFELMQFTGLTDKNGKEIYEGDIVRGYFNVNEVEDYIYIHLTKEEKETGSKIFTVDDIHFGYAEQVPEELEVIGNIYENPELLKV